MHRVRNETDTLQQDMSTGVFMHLAALESLVANHPYPQYEETYGLRHNRLLDVLDVHEQEVHGDGVWTHLACPGECCISIGVVHWETPVFTSIRAVWIGVVVARGHALSGSTWQRSPRTELRLEGAFHDEELPFRNMGDGFTVSWCPLLDTHDVLVGDGSKWLEVKSDIDCKVIMYCAVCLPTDRRCCLEGVPRLVPAILHEIDPAHGDWLRERIVPDNPADGFCNSLQWAPDELEPCTLVLNRYNRLEVSREVAVLIEAGVLGYFDEPKNIYVLPIGLLPRFRFEECGVKFWWHFYEQLCV